jgi:hypothetical protein
LPNMWIEFWLAHGCVSRGEFGDAECNSKP